MSQAIIRKAFTSRLNTWAASNGFTGKVAFENTAFTPPSTAYLKCYILPAATRDDFLEGGHRSYKGVFQVSIVMEPNKGPAAADTFAAAMDVLFPKTFTQDGLIINMTMPMSQGPSVQEGDRYTVAVSGNYEVNVTA